MGTIEELFERKSRSSGLEIENTTVGIRNADHDTLCLHKLALTSGGRSVGVACSLTQTPPPLFLMLSSDEKARQFTITADLSAMKHSMSLYMNMLPVLRTICLSIF
jgi:hypothetical protein